MIKRKRLGRFIVFEGSDGSGKTTQAKLLFNYLKSRKIPTAYISFPRYADSAWGAMVRRYLDGDFGILDPYLAAILYAGDRASAANLIRDWIEAEKIVVCDRYVASSVAHLGAKIRKETDRKNFVKWLEGLEYGENKIPREDLVVFLDMPREYSVKLMAKRKLDIHEADKERLKNAIAIYQSFARQRKYWLIINAVEDGRLFSVEEVSKKVLDVLKKRKIL